MAVRSFLEGSLVCFEREKAAALGLGIAFSMFQDKSRLRCTYRISDPSETIQWASKGKTGSRMDELWKYTCFEFFYRVPGEKPYVEWNVSPQGAWNAYHLDDYRTGLSPLKDAAIPMTAWMRDWSGVFFQWEADITLKKRMELEVAAMTRIKNSDGSSEVLHWALGHAGDAPDFHRLGKQYEVRN